MIYLSILEIEKLGNMQGGERSQSIERESGNRRGGGGSACIQAWKKTIHFREKSIRLHQYES
jgi:hypothetical protein